MRLFSDIYKALTPLGGKKVQTDLVPRAKQLDSVVLNLIFHAHNIVLCFKVYISF